MMHCGACQVLFNVPRMLFFVLMMQCMTTTTWMMAAAEEEVPSAMLCMSDSLQWTMAEAFCTRAKAFNNAECYCERLPTCQRRRRSYKVCDVPMYAQCLNLCGYAVDTVICRKGRVTQCQAALSPVAYEYLD
ncbi:hypothetical protein BC940DRAFT_365614 [Gongronella butleri]|nr:hypothetical protein BC940DRAFT_365614 [Gongronella butleri]